MQFVDFIFAVVGILVNFVVVAGTIIIRMHFKFLMP